MPDKPTDPSAPELASDISVEFPLPATVAQAQDEEWCDLRRGEQVTRLRFHDYHEIYAIPGLYEHLFYDRLKCCSPRVVAEELKTEVEKAGEDFGALRILDVGAGNGLSGEELKHFGACHVVGTDILEEAALATARDRPHAYKEYIVADLTCPKPPVLDRLRQHRFNALVTVGALGFGDIPVEAFCEALRTISVPGWVAFNLNETYLQGDDGLFALKSQRRYRHRLSTSGEPLYYVSIVCTLCDHVPAEDGVPAS